MSYRAEFTGVRENVWSHNALTFETESAAKDYALDLLGRWMGADMARVVDDETPKREPLDTNDPRIVANYRS
jgi:hypothetical protein